MTTTSPSTPTPSPPELRSLCTEQLSRELTLLTAAVQSLRCVDTALRQRSADLAGSTRAQTELVTRLAELGRRRREFGAAAGGLLKIAPDAVTLPMAIDHLPAAERGPLGAELAKARALAQEIVAGTRRLSLFLRIHLDAYRRILRDLTNTRASSGRYGPTGNAESLDYRPLIQIHG